MTGKQDEFQARLNQANKRLKAGKVGVSIQQKGDRLVLRSTLPAKPGSKRINSSQQRIYLGVYCNPAGIVFAEAEAKKVGANLALGRFSWEPYLKVSEPSKEFLTCKEWIDLFEEDYFSARMRSPQTATTWKHSYMYALKKLPPSELLTGELLLSSAKNTQPDTRSRQLVCMALAKFAKFAGITVEFATLSGSYSPSQVKPRDIPSDELIAEWRDRIPNPSWQWAFGAIATYGLRNHEIFNLDFSSMPVLQVCENTKTGLHRVYPILPEWYESWGLGIANVPICNRLTNKEKGETVTRQFNRYEIPFSPLDLRHAWAIRSMEFGLPIELAAAQMGHSVEVHSRVYHQWISDRTHAKAYEAIMRNRLIK
jgi:integrase